MQEFKLPKLFNWQTASDEVGRRAHDQILYGKGKRKGDIEIPIKK